LEYYRQKADIRLPVTASNVMSPEETWKDALEALRWKAPTQQSQCVLENSVFCQPGQMRVRGKPIHSLDEKDPELRNMVEDDKKNEEDGRRQASDMDGGEVSPSQEEGPADTDNGDSPASGKKKQKRRFNMRE
jgi:hypothetical protein